MFVLFFFVIQATGKSNRQPPVVRLFVTLKLEPDGAARVSDVLMFVLSTAAQARGPQYRLLHQRHHR